MRKWISGPLVFALSAVAFLALTWGFHYNWPDYVHVDYGLPLTWAINTLSTIIGPPAAPWFVDIVALQIDLLFWLALIIGSILVGIFTGNKHNT